MCVCMYVCVYVCMYVYIYVCVQVLWSSLCATKDGIIPINPNLNPISIYVCTSLFFGS